MLEELTKHLTYQELDYHEELSLLIEESSNFKHDKNCYIHGDLGRWNLLFNSKGIYIIDYGEVRKGNNHFDISVVLDSTIDWRQQNESIVEALINFKEGYLTHFESSSWNTLRGNFTIWIVRGIVALFSAHGINDKTKSYAKKMLERKNKIDEILVFHLIKSYFRNYF